MSPQGGWSLNPAWVGVCPTSPPRRLKKRFEYESGAWPWMPSVFAGGAPSPPHHGGRAAVRAHGDDEAHERPRSAWHHDEARKLLVCDQARDYSGSVHVLGQFRGHPRLINAVVPPRGCVSPPTSVKAPLLKFYSFQMHVIHKTGPKSIRTSKDFVATQFELTLLRVGTAQNPSFLFLYDLQPRSSPRLSPSATHEDATPALA